MMAQIVSVRDLSGLGAFIQNMCRTEHCEMA